MYKVFSRIIILLQSLLFLLLLPTEVNSFGKRRCRKDKMSKDRLDNNDRHRFYNPLTDSKEDCIDPHCSCGSVEFGIVQNIPYLPLSSSSNSVNIRFSSACIRCGLCQAVAEQINQTLIDTHDMMQPDNWLNETEALYLFKEICDQGFRHYSLREISGKRYICDRIPGATLVTSTADGLWEKNLKNKCIAYIAEAGPMRLYKHWQRWSGFDRRLPDLITILCRGEESIFRDCKSIPNLSRPELKKADGFFAKIRVMVEVKCK